MQLKFGFKRKKINLYSFKTHITKILQCLSANYFMQPQLITFSCFQSFQRELHIKVKNICMDIHIFFRGSSGRKLGPETDPSQKIGDLKTDTSQKSETLTRTLKLKILM